MGPYLQIGNITCKRMLRIYHSKKTRTGITLKKMAFYASAKCRKRVKTHSDRC